MNDSIRSININIYSRTARIIVHTIKKYTHKYMYNFNNMGERHALYIPT